MTDSGLYRLSDLEVGVAAGVTDRQGVPFPAKHLIPPLVCLGLNVHKNRLNMTKNRFYMISCIIPIYRLDTEINSLLGHETIVADPGISKGVGGACELAKYSAMRGAKSGVLLTMLCKFVFKMGMQTL
jgi:hypothetical protein